MISPSYGISSGYSGSALRFGLVDIKPIEVVETIKRFGVKFRRITRTFETLKPSQSYSDWVTLKNEVIFAKIDVPDWFEAQKLVTMYSQRSIEHYEKDVELKRAIEELRKSKRIGRPLLSFIGFVIGRFEAKREQYLEIEAKRFLDSNFPLSFFNKFVVFENTYYDFLKTIEQIVRIYEFRARSARNFKMYQRHITAMKNEISPILDVLDTCFFSASCLKKYVSIWNAKSYEEIYEPEFLDISKIDYPTFEQLNTDFKMKLTESRRLLLAYDPRILKKEPHLKNEPTANMFGKLVTFPLGSLSLER